MCQATEDDLSGVMTSRPDFKNFRKCLKCEKNSVVVTRISEALCKECFMEYFTHKFRATIGKHKILAKDEDVLFAYSGSGASVAMLHLIAQGINDQAFLKKKFTFKPTILFIEDHKLFEKNVDNTARKEYINKVLKSLEYSKFKVYFSLIENVLLDKDQVHFEDIDQLTFDDSKRDEMIGLIGDIKGDTSREEMIKRLRTLLINKISKELGFEKVLFALSCSKLTIDLLSNVAMGKGAHIAQEMAINEKRDGLTYLRPLRELTSKEITFFNHFAGNDEKVFSSNSSLTNLPNSSIYRLTEKFINGLQNDFPTTVATVFRTSDKMVPFEVEGANVISYCTLCECTIDTNNNVGLASSAVNDLCFAKSIAKIDDDGRSSGEIDTSNLCYSCSVTVGEVKNKENLPKLFSIKSRTEIKNEIKEFLLENQVE